MNIYVFLLKLKGLCGVPESLILALSRTSNKDFIVISNEGGVNHHGLDVLLELKKVNFCCPFYFKFYILRQVFWDID
jgi:acyl CoA:acetate/3-ketoacid CoA transferase alpha subunit